MAGRPIEDTPTSLYAVLGVSRYATAADIKRAYRDKAKSAHPDAGGSVAAMAQVNQAYTTLSDPEARRRYDAGAAQPSAAPTYRSASRPAEPQATRTYQPPPRPDTAAHDHHEHLRRRWARQSAWEIARISFLFVAGLTVLTLYFAPRLAEPPAFWILFLIIVVPLFTLLFGLVATVAPSLRLAIYDFSPKYRIYPTARQRRMAVRILAAAVVLAIIWAWMMVSISTPVTPGTGIIPL